MSKTKNEPLWVYLKAFEEGKVVQYVEFGGWVHEEDESGIIRSHKMNIPLRIKPKPQLLTPADLWGKALLRPDGESWTSITEVGKYLFKIHGETVKSVETLSFKGWKWADKPNGELMDFYGNKIEEPTDER